MIDPHYLFAIMQPLNVIMAVLTIAFPKKENPLMEMVLSAGKAYPIPKPGTLVEGTVIFIEGNKILVDLQGVATGLITGKEARDVSRGGEVKPGDSISAYVVDTEDDEGYFLLSLKKAFQEKTWRNFVRAYENGETLNVKISEANKGGLLVILDSVKGFIPVSQLAPLHYPRVDNANNAEIFRRLQKLVGETLQVKIITVDQAGGKLIFSEKAAMEDERELAIQKIKIGDVFEGRISGIVKFGIFVTFNGLEGLVHISEIEWGHVKDPTSYGKIGDPVKVKVIGIEGDKISLSMKQLIPDPWQNMGDDFGVGKVVEGMVDRITQFGVFLKLPNELSGLIHLSELSDEPVKDPRTIVKLGQKLKAKIISIDLEERRIGLSLKALKEETTPVLEEISADKAKEEKKAATKEEPVVGKTRKKTAKKK